MGGVDGVADGLGVDQMQPMGSVSAEEQDRWLLENRAAINLKISRGIEEENCAADERR